MDDDISDICIILKLIVAQPIIFSVSLHDLLITLNHLKILQYIHES